jgi:DNA-binding NarL/FixJ family response regulator
MSRMMRDIIDGAIESEPDMRVVGHFTRDDLELSIDRYAPDVVIAKEGCLGDDPPVTTLLLAHSGLKVVLLSKDEQSASLFELRESRLIDPSPASLIRTIRAALRRDET